MPKHLLLTLLLATTPAIAAQPVEPGQWEFTNTTAAVQMPSAPPTVLQQLVGKTTITRRCITPEQARAGLASAFKTRPECNLTVAETTGAVIDVTLVCKAQDGAIMTLTTHGSSTATTFAGTSHLDVAGAMHMT